MSAARASRRIEAAPNARRRRQRQAARGRAGDAIDRLTLDSGIAGRIASLAASDDPIDRIFAAYLSRSPDLYEFVAVEANREGQSSFTGAVGRALRDRYLRESTK